jgi:ATP-dependent Zn protease
MKQLLPLFLILLLGCSSGVKPLKFSNGVAQTGKPIVYTNTVQLVNKEQSKKIEVEIPITLSQKPGNTNLENVTVTLPKKIDLNIIIPATTNVVTLSGEKVKDTSFVQSPAFFLLYFLLLGLVAWGLYLWNKRNKPKNGNGKIKTPIKE